ncbi:MAG: hypothetical protein AAGI72_18190 [Pseudomonadota bacterium]
MKQQRRLSISCAALVALLSGVNAHAAEDRVAADPGEEGVAPALAAGFVRGVAPPRGDEARGPFDRLLITNAMVITGTGAPPLGP